jgi:tRNA modification GTPase
MGDAATIYALSSGHGRAGIAVIRISGAAAGVALDRMAPPRPKPRFAAFRKVRHPATSEVLDEALVLWFPAPNSETGEDMAELQIHGGRAVIAGVLEALGSIQGCRLAEPGEFARRSFENGKLDLTGVEGLADLVDAETAAQRRQALRQAGGALARIYEGWRTRLIGAMALLEAGIDFSDEADVAADTARRARAEIETLSREISAHLDDGRRGEMLREGFQVVLAGPPNVGKSSLLNALARREVAIVSDEPGTTRDVIEVKLDLDGLPVVVSDTAGLRETSSKVEQEGIRRTLGRARQADLVLWLVDSSAPAAPMPADIGAGQDLLTVLNKIDLVPGGEAKALPAATVAVSVLTGSGIGDLVHRLASLARTRMGTGEAPALTQVRHRQHLDACLASLSAFLDAPLADLELRAEDLRQAAQALGRITGAVDAEDILDRVFSRFCIGK